MKSGLLFRIQKINPSTFQGHGSHICDRAQLGHPHSNLHILQCKNPLGTAMPTLADAGLSEQYKFMFWFNIRLGQTFLKWKIKIKTLK
jgi:hypothetical protein